MNLRPFLQLMRPANIVTALADILAGAAVAGAWAIGQPTGPGLWLLLLATIGLYGGGVVFNDVFDLEIDREERPERPLPSGRISLRTAASGGALLLFLGVAAALAVSVVSGAIALLVAAAALLYDKYAKHHAAWGPLVMGLCRGGNLLLGMSIVVPALTTYWFLAILPILFIADITLTSQGEVAGENRPTLRLALALDATVVGLFLLLAWFTDYELLAGGPFLLLWWWMNSAAKLRALRDNRPALIQRAVKMGVLSLIPLNAAIAGGFIGPLGGIVVLLLLPLSLGLARYFAVT